MKKKHLFLAAILLGSLLSSCGGNGASSSSSSSTSVPPAPVTDYKKQFNAARKKSVEANQYQYDFALTAKIKFKSAASFSPAVYSGTTYVNASNEDTQFLQKRNVSGLLVIDSTNYIYNVGTDLVKISADEDKDFSVVNHETVSSVYDFDKNNFGYILKTLNDNQCLTATYSQGKYNLSLHTNFSQDSLLGVLNFIDSKTILKALNSYTKEQWGVGLSVNAWATLSDDNQYLKTFHFDASVSIKDTFDIGFEYEQTFQKFSNVSIALPSFESSVVSQDEVQTKLNKISNIYNASKNAATSYYDYDVKTTVDHGVSKGNPLGLAVNSRTRGYAKRQIVDDTVFFNNRLLVDSDYKNKDQYPDLVKDYDAYRAKLNDENQTVYDVLDPKVGFNEYTELTEYDEEDIDEYYMLPAADTLTYDSVKVIKQTTDKTGNNVYKFGLSTQGVERLLKEYNKSFRMDFNRVTIFDIYKISADFVAKKALYTVVTNPENNQILSVDLDLKGFYTELDSGDQVKYRLEVAIDYDWSKSYTAVSDKKDIDNN